MGCCTLARTYNACSSPGVKGAVDLRVSRIVFDSQRQDWQTISNPLRVLSWLQSRRKGCHSKKTLTQKQLKELKELERAEGWKNKPLHGQFLRQTEEIRDDATWAWLRKGALKKETEGMITAAQDQALKTNAIKAKVEN